MPASATAALYIDSPPLSNTDMDSEWWHWHVLMSYCGAANHRNQMIRARATPQSTCMACVMPRSAAAPSRQLVESGMGCDGFVWDPLLLLLLQCALCILPDRGHVSWDADATARRSSLAGPSARGSRIEAISPLNASISIILQLLAIRAMS